MNFSESSIAKINNLSLSLYLSKNWFCLKLPPVAASAVAATTVATVVVVMVMVSTSMVTAPVSLTKGSLSLLFLSSFRGDLCKNKVKINYYPYT